MRCVKIPAILSAATDLSCVIIRKRHRESRETISIVKPQIIWLYFGWFVTFRCVHDVTIAPRIATTAANKLRWRNCPDKIHYKSHYNLRTSALDLFEVTEKYLFSQYRLQTLVFNTGLFPASAKLAVKYRCQAKFLTCYCFSVILLLKIKKYRLAITFMMCVV